MPKKVYSLRVLNLAALLQCNLNHFPRLQRLSVDFSRASEALRTWGLGEGDDLGVRAFSEHKGIKSEFNNYSRIH